MMMTTQPAQTRRLAPLLSDLAPVSESQDVEVSGLALHSNAVTAGTLFLAANGTRDHGVRHIPEAIKRGAAAVVWEPAQGVDAPRLPPHIPVMAVPELGVRVGEVAARFYGNPSAGLTVVGVTGTDGKTSVTHFIAQALDSLGSRCGLLGTLGYGLRDSLQAAKHTTPDPIRLQAQLAELRDEGAQAVAMEVSSHALDQGRVNGVAFDVAVLTNLSRDHLDYHGSLEAYAAAKERLFRVPGLRRAVLNLDDPFGRSLLQSLGSTVTPMGYTLQGGVVEGIPLVSATEVLATEHGLNVRVSTSHGQGTFHAGVMGGFNAANLMAALAVLLTLGVPFRDALVQLGATKTVAGRMESFGAEGQPLGVVDYAHTPAALAQALKALRGHCRGSLWCVFGCGGERDVGKRSQMGEAAAQLADRVVITDDNPRGESPTAIVRQVLSGIDDPSNVEVIHDRSTAIRAALSQAREGDVVLIAGKGHEQMQIIGAQRLPFSDRKVVADYFQGIGL